MDPMPDTPPELQPVPPAPPVTSKDERMWAMFCHLGALIGVLISAGIHIPGGNVIVPLVIWILKKDQYALVNDQGKEAINFQITVFLALLACLPFVLILIGIFMMWAVDIVALIFTLIAAMKANEGVAYRYPYTFRFIK